MRESGYRCTSAQSLPTPGKDGHMLYPKLRANDPWSETPAPSLASDGEWHHKQVSSKSKTAILCSESHIVPSHPLPHFIRPTGAPVAEDFRLCLDRTRPPARPGNAASAKPSLRHSTIRARLNLCPPPTSRPLAPDPNRPHQLLSRPIEAHLSHWESPLLQPLFLVRRNLG